jgi:hypothetical protein
VQRSATTPLDKTSSTIKSEHLSSVFHPPANVFRRHLANDFTSKSAVKLVLEQNKSPAKTMSTTATKKQVSNERLAQSLRTGSSESNQRV